MNQSDRQKVGALTVLLIVFIVTPGIIGVIGLIAVFLFWSLHLYHVMKKIEKKTMWHYLFYGIAILINLLLVGLNMTYFLTK